MWHPAKHKHHRFLVLPNTYNDNQQRQKTTFQELQNKINQKSNANVVGKLRTKLQGNKTIKKQWFHIVLCYYYKLQGLRLYSF